MKNSGIERETSAAISDSLQTIRAVVIDETVKMSTIAPEISPSITSFATELLGTVKEFQEEIENKGQKGEDMLPAESLYMPISGGTSPSFGIARLYELINDYDKYLSNAIKIYDEEVARETEMTLFQRIVYELDYINIVGSNLGEVTTALKVVLLGNNSKPYRLEQIISLRKVLHLLRKDISVEETALTEILFILDEQFGLEGPLARVKVVE